MKHLLLLCFFICCFSAMYAQNTFVSNKPYSPPLKKQNEYAEKQSRLSPMTTLLLSDLKKSVLSKEALIKKYTLIEKADTLYAGSFLLLDSNFNLEELRVHGIYPGSVKNKELITALIPVNKIEKFSKTSGVHYIQIGEKASLTMDSARSVTKVNLVHKGTSLPQPYFGNGVVIGVIDGGFDYTHPNFYDNTGTNNYRIKTVWEQGINNGTAPKGYNYGRELNTQSIISNAGRDNPGNLHGTHVTGIAAGAGGGTSNTYMGVAPKAKLALVSTLLTNVSIADGITYIQDYANSVNKPSVINISIGGHLGPHDGSSSFDEFCKNAVGEGKILVGAAGNDGDKNIYLEKRFSTLDTNVYSFITFPNKNNKASGNAIIDLWGEPNKDFYVGVYIYNVNTQSFEDAPQYLYSGSYSNYNSYTLYDDDLLSPSPCYVEIVTGINPLNNKPRAVVYIDNSYQDDDYRFAVIQVVAKNTRTRMWATSGGAELGNLGFNPPVLSGVNTSTVAEIGGTGKNIISVGAFTSKNSWTSFYTNSKQQAFFYTQSGDVAPFSSMGPTADGRKKPDITAPGNVIVSSVNSFDNNYAQTKSEVVAGVTNGSNDWWYGTMQGTSMAAPMVTGIIALWLEMYPQLTPDQAKKLIKENGLTDNFTGNISSFGSDIWGWGKINAWVNLPAKLPGKPSIFPQNTDICEGTKIVLNAPLGYASYKWSNGDSTQSIMVNKAGKFRVRVIDKDGFKSVWSDEIDVKVFPKPAKPSINQNGNILISSAANGNQWYKDGVKINGATARQYTITAKGKYKVDVSNATDCHTESDEKYITPTGIQIPEEQQLFSVFPNPANNLLHIRINQQLKELSIAIYDSKGSILFSKNHVNLNKAQILKVDLTSFSTGNYLIKIQSNEGEFTKNINILR